MTQTACPIAEGEILLQTLVMPDPAICGEADLYVHRDTGVALELESGALRFAEGGTALFGTYMNLFNLGVWSRACALGGLAVRLSGEGRVAAQITREKALHDAEILAETMIDLSPDGVTLDLFHALGGDAEGLPPQTGLLKLRLVAHGPARLDSGGFVARPQDGPREVRLAVAITTFRREREVAATTERMTAFLDREGDRLGAEAHLFVVDNGGTAEIAPHPRVSRVENPNLGGAGGFARGLALAQDGDFTHCLFMDDDASFQMENLVRTIAFLRLARSEAAAVSGAMISEARKWMMWENGAVFHRMCRPQFVGTDLRNGVAVSKMELAAAAPKPPGFYGGWWFFAFPVAQARRFPFPFFVRGDDISFSLAHAFDTVTLNGVVSFQEDFSAKESPLTLYLDLRNHLHQHLVHPHLEIGPTGTTRIAMHFLLRSIIRMHYDSAEAQLAAWEDVMRGPEFFEENADMSKRRPEISALARDEAWKPMPDAAPLPASKEPPRWWGQLMKLTLNGHLVPLWSRLAGAAEVAPAERGLIWPLWGKARVRFRDAQGRGYEVTHDKVRFARIMWRALKLARRWRRAYPELRAAHREGYERLAARDFWETHFPEATPASVAQREPVPAQ
ncbi:glycosyl transferase [Limimaricola sp. ASW11-118]|uniref:Glycosyl transferase n=1 Tax=Limimaricola litoreus TaxID=2955316 RepID=A0A9X2FNZ5_9RHOB|nr:glycosyl transferase [Limimaricola litoreus]MCP1167004.1 glycosyl transferase [Limimaricola litoreus]